MNKLMNYWKHGFMATILINIVTFMLFIPVYFVFQSMTEFSPTLVTITVIAYVIYYPLAFGYLLQKGLGNEIMLKDPKID